MTWQPGRFYWPRVEDRPLRKVRGASKETQMTQLSGGPAPVQLPQGYVDQLNQANGLLQAAQSADQAALTTKAQADQLATQYAGQQAAALSAHQAANSAAQTALANLMAYFGIPPASPPTPAAPATPAAPPATPPPPSANTFGQ